MERQFIISIKKLMFLKQADVHIFDINSMAFRLTTSQASYRLTRSILLTLKEEFGLPLHLHSEEVSEIVKRVSVKAGGFSDADYGSGTIFEANLPPRFGNVFLVTGHRLVGKDREKMILLAKEVSQNLEIFGLSVVVNA